MALDAHLSRQLGFNLNRNADISIFLKKEGNEANTFIKVINYVVNCIIETIFGTFFPKIIW